jgi:beta-mannosidase
LILQDHSLKGSVGLDVQIKAQVIQAQPLKAAITVSHGGRNVAGATVALSSGAGRAVMKLRHPKLWWPAGMGEPALYDVDVRLLDARGNVIDSVTRRIGLRTLKLLPQDEQSSLRFEVNGVPFFAKGANWIPADAFATRVTPAILRRYVADAVAANMNMLRFWGGGYYEEDALFDACDEIGVCVWLDFKFACSSYPAFDEAFMENVRLEARDNLSRLRHHPCIAVWCGNNEISLMTKDQWSDNSMGRADYDKLFKDLLGAQVRELAPQANYVSGSPDCGDTHYWQVWHGGKPFEAYRGLTGFVSEFGFQSFPEPRTVRAYTAAEDRTSVLSPVMKWHQRSAGNGNQKIQDMTRRYFNAPKDFESALWLSQIVQAYGIKMGAEHWRQTMPQSMGCLFWQYNDCWPVASWSSVDYYGRWKALQYLARRFYAPILVCGVADSENGTVDIFVSSDRLAPCRGTLTWNITDVEGKTLARDSDALDIPPRQSQKVKRLDLRDQIQAQGANDVLVWLKLVVAGQAVSDNLVLLALPKELKLADPQLKTTVVETREGFEVTLTAEKPALWTWLSFDELDAKFSDNFVHVPADAPVRIRVVPGRRLAKAEFTSALRVRSLFDTYSGRDAEPAEPQATP